MLNVQNVMFTAIQSQTDLTMQQISAFETGQSILRQQLSRKTWGVHKIKDNDEMTKFYTGLPSFAIFMWLFK